MEILAMFITAVFAENLFFARAFDVYGVRELHKNPKKMLFFGLFLTAVLMLTGSVSYWVNGFIAKLSIYSYIRATINMLILVLLYVLIYVILEKFQPKLLEKVSKILPYAILNSVTLGTLILVAKDTEIDSFSKALSYYCGAGIGYTLSMLLLYSLHRRLSDSDCAKSFRGLPLQMITVGLIAMAMVGLVGNQLPA